MRRWTVTDAACRLGQSFLDDFVVPAQSLTEVRGRVAGWLGVGLVQ
jgi:hypothetical protein